MPNIRPKTVKYQTPCYLGFGFAQSVVGQGLVPLEQLLAGTGQEIAEERRRKALQADCLPPGAGDAAEVTEGATGDCGAGAEAGLSWTDQGLRGSLPSGSLASGSLPSGSLPSGSLPSADEALQHAESAGEPRARNAPARLEPELVHPNSLQKENPISPIPKPDAASLTPAEVSLAEHIADLARQWRDNKAANMFIWNAILDARVAPSRRIPIRDYVWARRREMLAILDAGGRATWRSKDVPCG